MKNYKLVNNLLGWLTFIVAAITYVLTIEPTASFWDCGEFISSAYKLEVGHPPGNPIFMLTANLFTQLASTPEGVAISVNIMSALFSALTILFLFWTITHLAKKLIVSGDKPITVSQLILIMGAGLAGAFAYTFSDTFWFSAVEGEVYAFSSLMTALVFWLILKWEDVADQPHADRWIILIAYLMGLSIAVHLLNLLCIPAIVLVYYYKKYPNPTLKGSFIALLLSFVLIVLILYGLIQGLVEVCGWFELFFVNTLGMPYNSGVATYILLIFAILMWGIWESMREEPNATRVRISFILAITLLGIPFMGSGYVLGILLIIALTAGLFYFKQINPAALNTILICLFVVTIGYSSYALIMIRSTANTPMNQNSPKDIFTLRTYLTREQYGETPLIYGRTYASEVKRVPDGEYCAPVTKEGDPVWTRVDKKDPKEKDRYYISTHKFDYEYCDELNMLFPRMYSPDPQHVAAYKEWANIKGKKVSVDVCGRNQMVTMPTFAENLRFFFSYQVNFMYWRYFMWNFAGRQNDIQGFGEVHHGNWITGIKFLDAMRVGPQENLPMDIAQNKGHNVYYMLPLLLGIIGILFQAYSGNKGIQGFWITFTLFFMTGLAIVLYLNQTPYQPRERDYAYAGSFYAFCIWIGLGVCAIAKILQQMKLPDAVASTVASVLCLLIPLQMAAQNWDDHDRSHRYVAKDFGQNYLTTCEPNAVIFTNGDNDTFPLWYNQEVEGFRTDVRVCNLSYLQTDWYIDQMKLEAYESKPLPINWHHSEYVQGTRDVAFVLDLTDKPIDVATALEWVRSDDERFKKLPGFTEKMDIIPSSILYIPIDSVAAVYSGTIKPEDAKWIPKEMVIDLRENKQQGLAAKNRLGKHELMILEMLNNNQDWNRPFYYAATVGASQYLRLEPYFRQVGIAYRISPFDVERAQSAIDTDVMFDNMMNKYKWGGIDTPGIYLDENTLRMTKTFRQMFGYMIKALIQEGKKDKALQALEYCQQVIPAENIPYDYTALEIFNGYYELGLKEKAIEAGDKILEYSMSNLRWYNLLKPGDFVSVLSSMRYDLLAVQTVLTAYQDIDPTLVSPYMDDFNLSFGRYSQYVKRPQATPSMQEQNQ